MVTFTPIKTWRIFNKLCQGNVLKEGIDWKKEAGEIYVIPSRLFLEAKKLRPEIEYQNVKSDEITPEQKKEQPQKETKKKPSGNKDSSSEIKRFQMKSDEITELLKEQVKELKGDKVYLQKQVGEKTEENKSLHMERAYLMKDWRGLVKENDNLRSMLTSRENEATETVEETHQESEPQAKDKEVAGEEKPKSSTTVKDSQPDNEADQKKVNKTKNVSKNIPKPKRKRGDDEQIGETIPKKPNQTPQNKQGKKPTKTKDKLRTEIVNYNERQPETKENRQPKKFSFRKWWSG